MNLLNRSPWRVTPTNPIREWNGELDYERCAALHNDILERGWVAAGHDLSDLGRTTYWDRYQNDPHFEGVYLSDSVIEFFKRALLGDGDITRAAGRPHYTHNLFRLLGGFQSPQYMVNGVNCDDNYPHRYLTIYTVPLQLVVSHGSGLVLDQFTGRAIYQLDLDDSQTTMAGRMRHLAQLSGQPVPDDPREWITQGRIEWPPFEFILDQYLALIDVGKVVALPANPQDGEHGRRQEWVDPWIMRPYTEFGLAYASSQFERLVVAIEARMPPGSLPDDDDDEEDEHDDDEWKIVRGSLESRDGDGETPESVRMFRPGGFARRFLNTARRPRFRFIAPGLTFVGAESQPFAYQDLDPEEGMIRPVLLARGAENAVRDTNIYGSVVHGFLHDFPGVAEIPCGLYLTETRPEGTHPVEDGCRLFLPYHIGSAGHARRSDDTYLGEPQRCGMLSHAHRPPPLDSSNLHQQGYNPFGECHDVQLGYVLERWAELVESGYWEVDADGVKGGIEKWREADTEEFWEKYQLPFTA